MFNEDDFDSIVTHFDLDGVASAALLSLFCEFESITFAGPSNMHRFSYEESTIVADLPHPYPRSCGFWFDHHVANIAELPSLNTENMDVPSVVKEAPSCLRVIYDHFASEYEIEDWEPFVAEVDTIDGFLFQDFQHWQEISPAKIIDHAIKYDYNDFSFLRNLVFMLRDSDFTDVAKDPEVQKRAELFQRSQDEQLPMIEKVAQLLPGCEDIVLLDMTELKNPPKLEKNLAYTFFPNGKSVLTVRSIYQRGQKTNGLSFSMSLGFVDESVKKSIDIGEMMRTLDIGSGHPGAAAGRFDCKSKDERMKRKSEIISLIADMWISQSQN